MRGPLLLGPSISIEESHRLIDEAIEKHQASILALKSQKNSLAPVSSLPPEILCKIFLFLKQGYGEKPSSSLLWSAVTHVSSHWRRVAVNSPSLWVDPPLGNIRWVKEMLKRSKAAGLVINVTFHPTSSFLGDIDTKLTPGFKLTMKHCSSIRHLSVRNIHELSAQKALQKALPRLAPCLEYFSITENSEVWNRWPFDGTPKIYPIVIPEGFLGATERLRHLELHKCHLNWDSQPFLLRSLTYLKLHDLSLDSKPTGKQLADALKGMPNLQFLDLKNAFPPDRTPWASNHIHLVSLHTLILRSTSTEIETFLHCITFPAAATIKVECVVDRDSTSDAVFYGVFLGLAQSYSNALPATIFKSLILTPPLGDVFGFRLRLFRDSVLDEQTLKDGALPACLELSFGWETELESEQQVTKLMINTVFSGAIHLHDITYIYLEHLADNLSSKMIADSFGKLPHLRTVRLGNCSRPSFLNALKFGECCEEAGWNHQVKTIYFPSLSIIHLDGILFGEPEEEAICMSVRSLQDCLVRRSALGVPIEKLIITYCSNFYERDLDLLSQFIDNLDWDHDESHPSDNLPEYDSEEDMDYEVEGMYPDEDDLDNDPDYPLEFE